VTTSCWPKHRMRVTYNGPEAAAIVRVRANGVTLLDSPLVAGQPLEFDAPDQPGWVRATLLRPGDEAAAESPTCDPNGAAVSTCTYDQTVVGLTSPIYLR
jgi:hypothetical protein